MFQFDFGGTTRSPGPPLPSAIDADAVARVAVVHWEEHCLECAQPQCYRSCPLFVRRADTNCARFDAGIGIHGGYRGLFDHAAEIRFRKWGKLQTTLGGGALRVASCRRLQSLDRHLGRCSTHADVAPRAVRDVRLLKPQTWFNKARTLLLDQTARSGSVFRPDELLIEAWSLAPGPFRLCVELQTDTAVLHRESFPFGPGHNLHRSSAVVDRLPPAGCPARLLVYPENDHEAHLAFTWLDLVAWRPTALQPPVQARAAVPAPTVKCVVWDLDQTLWQGTVGEDGPAGVILRDECVALIHALDDRGILQSVASKNDHDLAWGLLERQGLADYFLHPQIGWSAKSAAVGRIAAQLNIGIDTIAVIDDAPFERAEISAAHPAVRTYDPGTVAGLLTRPEFTVPITAEARGRRALYRAEARRQSALTGAAGDPREFLRGCRLLLTVSQRFTADELARCAELLQRTNQLNLSGRRLARAEVERLVADPSVECLHLRCADRFGDYGLVGFVALAAGGDTLTITDLVLSCRVAAKKVENALARHLQHHAASRGARTIVAAYVPSARNGVLLSALGAAGFTAGGGTPALAVSTPVPDADIVAIATAD